MKKPPYNPQLDFDHDADSRKYAAAISRMSISGAQEKLSAIVQNGKLVLTPGGQHGQYIIKPIPSSKHLKNRRFLPANEQLTMKIAKEVYGIVTAESDLVHFANGKPAYVIKRFDIDATGNKVKQEDFASLAGKSRLTHGEDFKYTGGYEDVATLLKQNIAAYSVELTRLFTLIVFNYLFCNGDAHLKNFSLQQTPEGDYLLSPAYDLVNTALHIDDADFALEDGLLPKSEWSDIYTKCGHPCKRDFITFGTRIGVLPQKITSVISMFCEDDPRVRDFINGSALDEKTRRHYLRLHNQRLQRFLRGCD